jgi:hypothetical protein
MKIEGKQLEHEADHSPPCRAHSLSFAPRTQLECMALRQTDSTETWLFHSRDSRGIFYVHILSCSLVTSVYALLLLRVATEEWNAPHFVLFLYFLGLKMLS